MKTKDGGPAFPLCGSIVKQYQPTGIVTGESLQGFQSGMSLRDYFAAKALQGLLSYTYASERFRGDLKVAAIEAYEIADAMLEAREK